ncbi:MAG: hypothetical protein PGN25_17105 [Methylorubrum populi]
MTNRTPLLLAAVSLCVLAGAARADDGPPKLDIESTCKSAERAQVSLDDNANKDACLNSERGAHADLKKRWSEFPASAKKQCSQQFQAGGYPSYVELVTCLELASGTVPSQPAHDRPAHSDVGGGSGGGGKESSRLTREPSPAQRTDPIDVLHNR